MRCLVGHGAGGDLMLHGLEVCKAVGTFMPPSVVASDPYKFKHTTAWVVEAVGKQVT